MPVQNETCLVIADADGSHPREISDITNTSSVLFAKDAFFALLRDGNGNTQCYRYEVSDPEKRTLYMRRRKISAWCSIRTDICI
ncbi:MAG: hypothetical protein ACLT76_10195 [Clostridium fessum]